MVFLINILILLAKGNTIARKAEKASTADQQNTANMKYCMRNADAWHPSFVSVRGHPAMKAVKNKI